MQPLLVHAGLQSYQGTSILVRKASWEVAGKVLGLHVLLLNLAMDLDDPVLGFTGSWVNALAERVANVTVVTMTAGHMDVRANVTVHSLGKERGHSEPRRLLEFYRAIGRAARARPVDACFAHMSPLFASLFTPVGRILGIPTLLWYAHGAVSMKLRLAHFLVDRCVTSTPFGFRLPSSKLYVIGQGIDGSRFRPPAKPSHAYPTTLVTVGRTSATKRIHEMVEALARVRHRHGEQLRLEIWGGPATEQDLAYERSVRERAEQLGIGDAVVFSGRVSYAHIPTAYQRGAVFVNLCDSGSLDKAILEAMASGCVTICRNEAFAAIAAKHGLETLVPGPSAKDLAESIERAATLAPTDRARVVSKLRRIVEQQHSLDRLSDTLVRHLCELADARQTDRTGGCDSR